MVDDRRKLYRVVDVFRVEADDPDHALTKVRDRTPDAIRTLMRVEMIAIDEDEKVVTIREDL